MTTALGGSGGVFLRGSGAATGTSASGRCLNRRAVLALGGRYQGPWFHAFREASGFIVGREAKKKRGLVLFVAGPSCDNAKFRDHEHDKKPFRGMMKET
jgi:hypothetical protein